MASLSHNLEYVATLTGVRLARMMSSHMADSFGAGLGSFVRLLSTSRRRIAHENLRKAIGITLTDKEMDAVVKNVFKNIGRSLVEFSRFGKTSQQHVLDIVVGDGEDYLREALEKGHGGIITTAHFGCWEMLGAWFGCLGYPMDFLVGTQHNAKVDGLFNDFRRAMGVGIIPLKSSIRGVYKALRANHLVGLVADQHTGDGLSIDFFGRKAAAAKGPATFAVKIGSPILPFLMRRQRYDRHVVIAGKPLYPRNDSDPKDEIQRLTIECNKFFEEGIRQYPDQWMWTHRRWKL
ncbi:MAG: lysophospholipid acyltransferase family protein [candidate division Zixibacteria bacterium]|nr:lysophospholipid acyltransferase family protein [candidate division Zixibacteria bacterium]